MFQEPIHRSTFPLAWAEAPAVTFISSGPAPPPEANPCATPPRAQHLQQPQALMAHVHPWIANRMKEYHAWFKGKVMMTKILNGANTTFDRLPVIQEFVNKDSNKNELCYNHVMGTCSNRRCWYRHASKAQVPNSFAGDLIQLCGPGIDYVVCNEPQGWGAGQRERRSDSGYYGRAVVGSGGATSGNGGGVNNQSNGEGGQDGKQQQRDNQQRYDSPGKQQRRT